jgi:hypothetical protein
MGLGTFVVLPPLLCTALRSFRGVPLSAQGSGGHCESMLDKLIEFPPDQSDIAALRTIIYFYAPGAP